MVGDASTLSSKYLEAYHQTALRLMGKRDLDELLQEMISIIRGMTQAVCGFLYLCESCPGDAVMQAAFGGYEEFLGNRIGLEQEATDAILQAADPMLLENGNLQGGFIPVPHLEKVCSLVAIPLKRGTQLMGFMGLGYEEPFGELGKEESSSLARLAELSAIAIDNASLYKGLQHKLMDRKKMEKELRRAKEDAEAASRAKSDFLASMSHELRTPLNSVIGFTELIVDSKFGPLNELQSEYLSYVLQSGQHLLALINDILDLAKIESGKIELHLSRVQLKDVLRESIAPFRETAMKNSILLTEELDDVPEMIMADRRKLRQIMLNLLSNAFKFTPKGGAVKITAQPAICAARPGRRLSDPQDLLLIVDPDDPEHETTETSVKCLQVSIRDTGVGIRQEDLQRIFNPFEQADPPLTRKFEGTGLGLSLTKKLVEIHGGRIWAESPGPGQGSTFWFVLPA